MKRHEAIKLAQESANCSGRRFSVIEWVKYRAGKCNWISTGDFDIRPFQAGDDEMKNCLTIIEPVSRFQLSASVVE